MNCSICGRCLTDPDSIKREIGPICYSGLKKEQQSSYHNPSEIILTPDMGGEIETFIKETRGKEYRCLGLSGDHIETVRVWYGYPHDGGIQDKNGKKWWANTKCSKSNYEMSWWKVQKNAVIIELEVY